MDQFSSRSLLYEDWIPNAKLSSQERKKLKEKFVKEFTSRTRKATIPAVINSVVNQPFLPAEPAPQPSQPQSLRVENDVFRELLDKNIQLQKENDASTKLLEELTQNLQSRMLQNKSLSQLSNYSRLSGDKKFNIQEITISVLNLNLPRLGVEEIVTLLRDVISNMENLIEEVPMKKGVDNGSVKDNIEKSSSSTQPKASESSTETPKSPKAVENPSVLRFLNRTTGYVKRSRPRGVPRQETSSEEDSGAMEAEDGEEEDPEEEEGANNNAEDEIRKKLMDLVEKSNETVLQPRVWETSTISVIRQPTDELRLKYCSKIQKMPGGQKSILQKRAKGSPKPITFGSKEMLGKTPAKPGFETRLSALSTTLNGRQAIQRHSEKIKRELEEAEVEY